MYTMRGRLLCGALGLVLGAYLLLRGQPFGWLLLAQPALLAWGYRRYGTTSVAYAAYVRRDWPRLERLLAEMRSPAQLAPQARTYYAFLSGVAAAERGEWAAALQAFDAVVPEQLRNDNVRSLLAYHRAAVHAGSGAPEDARAALAAARALPHREDTARLIGELDARVAVG